VANGRRRRDSEQLPPRGENVPARELGAVRVDARGIPKHLRLLPNRTEPTRVTSEPLPTAIFLAAVGILMATSVLASRASGRLGLPVALLFLGVGILAGSEGIGGIPFEDYQLGFRIGTTALTLILFDGGLNTPISEIKNVWKPAGVLATVGVALTCVIMALGGLLLGMSWNTALLFGAVVSSTDAAAVFSILRGGGVHLQKRLAETLEVESGSNDPMAVILTFTLTGAIMGGGVDWTIVPQVLLQLAVGTAAGVAFGYLGRFVLATFRLPAGGLYPVLTMALALTAFGIPTILQGSGFLAVYVAGIVLGAGDVPYRSGLFRVHDAAAWFSQVSMFLVLGLLVFPSRLLEVSFDGIWIALFLVFVARPAAVALCLLPFREYTKKEIGFIGWVGLRGAVPITLAMFPLLSGAPGAERLFDLVFFVVVISSAAQGGTLRWLTRKLGFERQAPPASAAVLEIVGTRRLHGKVMHFFVQPVTAAAGSRIADLPFPPDSAVMLIVRDDKLIAPRGGTQLHPGDHVYVVAQPEDEALVHLVFGAAGE
jgi:cell volume regulation protein A